MWTESSVKGRALICTSTSCGAAKSPRTGSYLAWMGSSNSETAELRQTVTLPAGQPAYLSYWYQIDSADYCGYDYGYVRVLVNGTTTTLKTFRLCTTTKTTGWVGERLNLSTYAGRTVTLIFRARTDSSLVSSFFLDDTLLVNSNTCPLGAPVTDQVEMEQPGEDIEPSMDAKPEPPAGMEAAEQ